MQERIPDTWIWGISGEMGVKGLYIKTFKFLRQNSECYVFIYIMWLSLSCKLPQKCFLLFTPKVYQPEVQVVTSSKLTADKHITIIVLKYIITWPCKVYTGTMSLLGRANSQTLTWIHSQYILLALAQRMLRDFKILIFVLINLNL